MGTDTFTYQFNGLAAQRARRRALGLLGLAGLAGFAGGEAADARNRKKKRKNTKKKKRRVGALPTTAAPVGRTDASCMFPETGTGAGGCAGREGRSRTYGAPGGFVRLMQSF